MAANYFFPEAGRAFPSSLGQLLIRVNWRNMRIVVAELSRHRPADRPQSENLVHNGV